jgi:hypothetical protein
MHTIFQRFSLGLAVIFCTAFMVPSAQARVRDDVMAGAFRCGGVGDSRLWLDCYYGAAQPARAALGLSPAPAVQSRLAFSPPGGDAPHDIDVRDQVMADAARCISVAGDRPWLDCYYGASAPLRARLGLPALAVRAPVPAPLTSAPVAVARTPSGPPPMPRDRGMLEGVFTDLPPVVRHVPMKSYSQDRSGAFTVTLADGQVWRQLEEDAVYHPAHWRGDELPVTISPAAMHTYIMMVGDESRIYKVKRIR